MDSTASPLITTALSVVEVYSTSEEVLNYFKSASSEVSTVIGQVTEGAQNLAQSALNVLKPIQGEPTQFEQVGQEVKEQVTGGPEPLKTAAAGIGETITQAAGSSALATSTEKEVGILGDKNSKELSTFIRKLGTVLEGEEFFQLAKVVLAAFQDSFKIAVESKEAEKIVEKVKEAPETATTGIPELKELLNSIGETAAGTVKSAFKGDKEAEVAETKEAPTQAKPAESLVTNAVKEAVEFVSKIPDEIGKALEGKSDFLKSLQEQLGGSKVAENNVALGGAAPSVGGNKGSELEVG